MASAGEYFVFAVHEFDGGICERFSNYTRVSSTNLITVSSTAEIYIYRMKLPIDLYQ